MTQICLFIMLHSITTDFNLHTSQVHITSHQLYNTLRTKACYFIYLNILKLVKKILHYFIRNSVMNIQKSCCISLFRERSYIASNFTSHSVAPGLGLADPNSFFSIANPGITNLTTTLVRLSSSVLTVNRAK